MPATTTGQASPPANPEAEQSVLGAILVRPEALDRIAVLIAPEDFYREAHGRIFRSMIDLHGKGEPVDLVTVTALLKERGHLEGIGGPVFLAALSEQVGFATNAEYYARIVRKNSYHRKFQNLLEDLLHRGQKQGASVEELLTLADSKLLDLIESVNGDGKADLAPPLDPSKLIPISELIRKPPPSRDYLIKEVLPAGIVGGVMAVGGTGKGFLLTMLALGLAACKKLGPLGPARKFKVLYLAGEDNQEELQRRIFSTVKALWPDGPPSEIDNFIPFSVAGKLGPLMQFDGARNPINAPTYDWVCKTLENLTGVDVLILDPKSKFYGLDENDNAHCAAWINCLESLAARFNITILFSHHESKARAGSMDQASSRGGSALTDGCRWVANIKTMDEKTAEKYQITEPHNFVVLDVTKNNYAPRLPAPVYFRRGAEGALFHVDLATDRVKCLALKLVDLLEAATEPFSRRDLVYGKKGSGIADELKEAVSGFSRARDINLAVDHALKTGWLVEAHHKGKTGPGKLILKVSENAN